MPKTTITYTMDDIVALFCEKHGVEAKSVHTEISPEQDDGPNRFMPATFSVSVDVSDAPGRDNNLP